MRHGRTGQGTPLEVASQTAMQKSSNPTNWGCLGLGLRVPRTAQRDRRNVAHSAGRRKPVEGGAGKAVNTQCNSFARSVFDYKVIISWLKQSKAGPSQLYHAASHTTSTSSSSTVSNNNPVSNEVRKDKRCRNQSAKQKDLEEWPPV